MNQLLIPQESAIELCQEVLRKQGQSRIRFLKFNFWQCWGCQRFGNKDGSYSNICALNTDDNRGCRMVNKLYDEKIASD